jgi:hypothetical protein
MDCLPPRPSTFNSRPAVPTQARRCLAGPPFPRNHHSFPRLASVSCSTPTCSNTLASASSDMQGAPCLDLFSPGTCFPFVSTHLLQGGRGLAGLDPAWDVPLVAGFGLHNLWHCGILSGAFRPMHSSSKALSRPRSISPVKRASHHVIPGFSKVTPSFATCDSEVKLTSVAMTPATLTSALSLVKTAGSWRAAFVTFAQDLISFASASVRMPCATSAAATCSTKMPTKSETEASAPNRNPVPKLTNPTTTRTGRPTAFETIQSSSAPLRAVFVISGVMPFQNLLRTPSSHAGHVDDGQT